MKGLFLYTYIQKEAFRVGMQQVYAGMLQTKPTFIFKELRTASEEYHLMSIERKEAYLPVLFE